MEAHSRFRLPVARDGLRFILPFAAIALLFHALGWRVPAGVSAVVALMIAWFFRDPERKTPRIAGALVAPADGRITAIEEVAHDGFPDGRARRISIFLSLFNVHINRSPLSGRVEAVDYRPGHFHNALSEASARENERNRIQLRNGSFGVYVDQIAGLIARRVVCNCGPGDSVEKGQRIGLIRFGSRTDTYFPLEADVRVKKGMKVSGGETVLAICQPESTDTKKTT